MGHHDQEFEEYDKSDDRRRARQRLLFGRTSDPTTPDRPPADMSGAGSSPVVGSVDRRTDADQRSTER